jgi:hypothetical protein
VVWDTGKAITRAGDLPRGQHLMEKEPHFNFLGIFGLHDKFVGSSSMVI